MRRSRPAPLFRAPPWVTPVLATAIPLGAFLLVLFATE